MRPFVDWLLNLQGVDLSGSHVRLDFAEAPAGWLVALAIAALVAYVAWVYRREGSTPRRRGLLAVLRGGVVLLVLGLIFRPVLVVERTTVYPSTVLVLADKSTSMTAVKDRYTDAKEAAQAAAAAGLPADQAGRLADLTRADLLAKVLARPFWGDLAGRNTLQLFRFAEGTDRIGSTEAATGWSGLVTALAAQASMADGTNLFGAVRTALQDARAQRVAGVVVLSDGRNTSRETLADALAEARRSNVPVFPVLVGATNPPRDIWLDGLKVDSAVFVRDRLAVNATLHQRGLRDPTPIVVKLANAATGADLATQTVTVGGDTLAVPVELRFKPDKAGDLQLRVSVEPLADEMEAGNNVQTATVRVVDEKLRVLYVEDLPRWEYRFLKTMLVREPTVASSLWLQSAVGSGFAQEGTEPIKSLPDTAAQLNQYDVIILGDIDPAVVFPVAGQMELLAKFVSERGGGMAFIAGPMFSPRKFIGTPLERVLPIRPDPVNNTDATSFTAPFEPQLTPEGRVSPLLRLEDDPAKSLEVFAKLPPLFWYARALGVRPGAEVLLQHPSAATGDGPIPLLVTSRFGAGKTLYLGTDETWRWRRGVGEVHFESFWLNAIRFLSRDKLRGQTREAVLTFGATRAELGGQVRLSLAVLNPELLAGLKRSVTVQILDERRTAVASVELARVSDQGREFVGSWVPPGLGRYTAEWAVTGLRDAAAAPRSDVLDVTRPDAESRDLSTDPAILAQLAEQTGGRLLTLGEAEQLPRLIGDRSQQVNNDLVRDLWDSRLAMMLIVALLTAEWVLRKASGLV